MMMFWLKRLKQNEADSAWALSYGDLMSLLLAVFVMIAAMSELRQGEKFERVRASVLAALGFGEGGNTNRAPAPNELSLLERLERAGLDVGAGGAMMERELADACEIRAERDRVVIRLAGSSTFDRFSARLRPQAQRLVERLAIQLKEGFAQLEIRGHGGDGEMPSGVAYRDAFDLSYQRARAVADLLQSNGVAVSRMRATACGDSEPLLMDSQRAVATGVNRRVEIAVHAVPAITGVVDIAEKGQGANG
jgi:flagellar motor protein MotB